MKRELKIAFFGSSLVSAYWNGAATYYRGIIRGLFRSGHHVTFYEPDAFQRQEHRDIAEPDYATSVVYDATDSAVEQTLEDAAAADVIIKASGVGVFDEVLEREVLRFQEDGKVVIFWDVDAPATLERVQNDPSDPFRQWIPRYDGIFTYGGGYPVVQQYCALGARRCIPVYNAFDPDIHHPVAADARFESTLGFLGNRMPDREERVWEFFFKAAALQPQATFLLGGSGWDQNLPQEKNIHYVGHVYTRDHNAFNCTPLAVLNVSRESMARNGYSPATRVFEAAGAGACVITDAWEGIESFLKPGSECLVAHSGEEVAAIVAALTPQRAKAIGQAALQRVRRQHTYQHRAAQVEYLLALLMRQRESVFV